MDIVEKMPNWLRWLLVLPLSAIAGTLCRWLTLFFYAYWTGVSVPEMPLLYSCIEGVATVIGFMGVLLIFVPSKKFLIAVIVTTLWSILIIFQALTTWAIVYPALPWANILYGLSAIIAMVYFTVQAYSFGRNESFAAPTAYTEETNLDDFL